MNWPYNYGGTGFVLTKILDISCAVNNTLTLPPANQVSTGEDTLIRNVGAQSLTVLDASGGNVATIPAGIAQYLWVTNNASVAGAWGQVTFGAGTSQLSAGALAGLGLVAIAATLNAATPVFATAGDYTVSASDRAELIEFNAGAAVLNLPAVATAGNDFLFYVKNGGAGVVTLTPAGGEMIDNQANLGLQPNESCMVVCSGVAWYTVGYGRSTLYQFSQLVLDVSGGGTFTLNATQASNKLLTFVGNPAGNVTVVVPNVVAIYYVQSNLSTAHSVTVKTSAGTGVVVPQSGRTVAIDDGTNVSAAVNVTSTTNLSLTDGTVSSPSLSFASQTNTGIYKYGATGFGITVAGVAALSASPTGTEIAGTVMADGVLTASTGLVVTTGGITSSGTTTLTGAVNVTGNVGVTGNEAVSGTLNVTGTTTITALTAVGAVNVTGNVGVTGNEAVSGTLNVTGLATLASALVSGNLNVSGTGVVLGAGVGSPVTYVAPGTAGNVLTNVAGVWMSAPSASGTYPAVARSTNTILGVSDAGKSFVATSTFTQTFTAAATLGNGWFAYYRNDGTGIITFDPNVSEQIDGVATLNLYAGEACLIVCDGSNFHTYGRTTGNVFIQKQTAANVASLNFVEGIDSDFDEILFTLAAILPATDDAFLQVRVSEDGGSTWKSGATDYRYTYTIVQNGASSANGTQDSRLFAAANTSNTLTDGGISGEVRGYTPADTTHPKSFMAYTTAHRTGTGPMLFTFGGKYQATNNAINGVQFSFNTGNMTSGEIVLYGVRKGL